MWHAFLPSLFSALEMHEQISYYNTHSNHPFPYVLICFRVCLVESILCRCCLVLCRLVIISPPIPPTRLDFPSWGLSCHGIPVTVWHGKSVFMCTRVWPYVLLSYPLSLCQSQPGAGAPPMMPGSPMMAGQQPMMRPQFPAAGAPGQPVLNTYWSKHLYDLNKQYISSHLFA